MNLKDALLMITVESQDHPELRARMRSAYDEMVRGQQVPHAVLSELVGEASGKGVLQAIKQKYSPTAQEAMMIPLSREIGCQRPVPR